MIFRKKKNKATCAAPQHVYSFDQQGEKVVLTCETCGQSIVVDA